MGQTTEATTMATAVVAEPMLVLQPLLSNDNGNYLDEEDALAVNEASSPTEQARVDSNTTLFRSKCSADILSTLPEVARSIEWSDPFYERNNNGDIVAAFDIDHTKLYNEMKSERTVRINFVTRIILSIVLLPIFTLWTIASDMWVYLFLVYPICFSVLQVCLSQRCLKHDSKDMLLAQRRHVAVTRRAIYLDDATADDDDDHGTGSSTTLARRQVIPLDAIASCRVVEVGWYRPSYQVCIAIKHGRYLVLPGDVIVRPAAAPELLAELRSNYAIRGVRQGQLLVNVVQALMNANITPLQV